MTEDRSMEPRFHRRGCPQHVHPSQRDPGVIAICLCGGIDPDDNGLAALAAALETVMRDSVARVGGPYAALGSPEVTIKFDRPAFAAAILGERGVFLPDGHPLGVEDAIAQGQARIAALNARIVDLNAEVLDRMDQWYRDSLARDELARQQNGKIATLRAALVGLVEAAEDILRGDEHDALRAALATAKEAGG